MTGSHQADGGTLLVANGLATEEIGSGLGEPPDARDEIDGVFEKVGL